jgi:hypothetical protein
MDVAGSVRDQECSHFYDRLAAKGYWECLWIESAGLISLTACRGDSKIRCHGSTHRQVLEAAALMAEGRWHDGR